MAWTRHTETEADRQAADDWCTETPSAERRLERVGAGPERSAAYERCAVDLQRAMFGGRS
jgi:hypothetical protein